MLGCERDRARLLPHQRAWADLFQREANELRPALGDSVVRIEHVGSTAVPGLEAKPILDIVVAVGCMTDAAPFEQALAPLGYCHQAEHDMPGRLYFVKRTPDGKSTHHLNITELGTECWFTLVAFRDYLRSHPEAREEYGALKRELARRHRHDRPAYQDGKAAFIQCTLAMANHCPLTVDEVVAVFRPMPVPWWIAGGVGLDLFLGEATRSHDDIDVLILRRDQLVVQEHLSDWQPFRTKAPEPPHLAPWEKGQYLEPPVNSIWVRSEDGGPWRFEIMLMEAAGDEWVYRRERSIRGKIGEMGLLTADGVSYLAPEIQLLYKSSTGRRKDADDLAVVLPRLSRQRAQWLLDCLRVQYPDGHGWGECLQRHCSG
jgi:GrpB-like predicted nucleotidyltransferase (UPF0157 family)